MMLDSDEHENYDEREKVCFGLGKSKKQTQPDEEFLRPALQWMRGVLKDSGKKSSNQKFPRSAILRM